MQKNKIGIGVDLEKIKNFKNKNKIENNEFLNRIFTENELIYCFLKKNPAQHLAVRFAGKEATIKAISSIKEMHNINYNEIEIMKHESGLPLVNILRKGFEGLNIYLTMSHSEDDAIAFVIIFNGF